MDVSFESPAGVRRRGPTAPTRRRPGQRWLVVLGSIGLALAAVWFLVVPPAIAAILRAQLQAAGFAAVHFGAVEVAFASVTVHDLRLGDAGNGGHVTIGRATAAFGWRDLWHRRIDSLVLSAPRWTMVPGELTPFAGVARAGRTPPDGARVLPELPLRRFAIRGGSLARAGTAMPPVAIDATLDTNGGAWNLDLALAMAAQPIALSVRLGEHRQVAAGTLALQIPGPQPLAFTGSCRLDGQGRARRLTIDLERAADAFEVALGGGTWSGSGGLALHAEVPFDQPDATVLEVRLDDFAAASGTARIDGLTTTTRLRGLPPVSAGPQQLRWRSLGLGAVAAGSGEATFALARGGELQLRVRQRASDEIGSIDTGELRLAAGRHRIPAEVVFDQFPLQELLERTSRGRITGEGRVSGSVALVVQTAPRLAIDLRGGRLAATPGGVVRFLDHVDTEQLLLQHVGQITTATGHDALVQDRLVAALKEFTFDVLDFHIDPDAGGDGVTLRVHAAGEGRRVPQRLDLRVNLHGFDTAVDTAIALAAGLDRARGRLVRKIDEPSPAPPDRRP